MVAVFAIGFRRRVAVTELSNFDFVGLSIVRLIVRIDFRFKRNITSLVLVIILCRARFRWLFEWNWGTVKEVAFFLMLGACSLSAQRF